MLLAYHFQCQTISPTRDRRTFLEGELTRETMVLNRSNSVSYVAWCEWKDNISHYKIENQETKRAFEFYILWNMQELKIEKIQMNDGTAQVEQVSERGIIFKWEQQVTKDWKYYQNCHQQQMTQKMPPISKTKLEQRLKDEGYELKPLQSLHHPQFYAHWEVSLSGTCCKTHFGLCLEEFEPNHLQLIDIEFLYSHHKLSLKKTMQALYTAIQCLCFDTESPLDHSYPTRILPLKQVHL